jgi:hypothetical protein
MIELGVPWLGISRRLAPSPSRHARRLTPAAFFVASFGISGRIIGSKFLILLEVWRKRVRPGPFSDQYARASWSIKPKLWGFPDMSRQREIDDQVARAIQAAQTRRKAALQAKIERLIERGPPVGSKIGTQRWLPGSAGDGLFVLRGHGTPLPVGQSARQ